MDSEEDQTTNEVAESNPSAEDTERQSSENTLNDSLQSLLQGRSRKMSEKTINSKQQKLLDDITRVKESLQAKSPETIHVSSPDWMMQSLRSLSNNPEENLKTLSPNSGELDHVPNISKKSNRSVVQDSKLNATGEDQDEEELDLEIIQSNSKATKAVLNNRGELLRQFIEEKKHEKVVSFLDELRREVDKRESEQEQIFEPHQSASERSGPSESMNSEYFERSIENLRCAPDHQFGEILNGTPVKEADQTDQEFASQSKGGLINSILKKSGAIFQNFVSFSKQPFDRSKKKVEFVSGTKRSGGAMECERLPSEFKNLEHSQLDSNLQHFSSSGAIEEEGVCIQNSKQNPYFEEKTGSHFKLEEFGSFSKAPAQSSIVEERLSSEKLHVHFDNIERMIPVTPFSARFPEDPKKVFFKVSTRQ